jgi:hypothetical protein
MVEDFRRWLREKYSTPAALSAAWRVPVGSFEEVEPPQLRAAGQLEDLLPRLDWLEFVDSREPTGAGGRATDYLSLHSAGGRDTSALRRLYQHVRLTAREMLSAGRPFAPQEVCRQIPLDDSPAALDFALRAALMHGASADAEPAARKAGPGRLLVDALRSQPWLADRKVLILYPRVYAQLKRLADELAATAEGGQAQPCPAAARIIGSRLHLDGPALLANRIHLVAQAKFPFTVADTRSPGAAPEALRQYPLVICPTLEMLEAKAMTALERYVLAGGFLALGPRIPLVDETLARNETLARHFGGALADFHLDFKPCGDGAFITLPQRVWPENIEFIAFESGLARGLAAESPALDSAVHRAGRRRLLFIANPHDQPVKTAIGGEPRSRLCNVETGDELPADQASKVVVPPESISAWEVE